MERTTGTQTTQSKKSSSGLSATFLRSIFAIVLALDLIISGMFFLLFSGTQINTARNNSVMQLEQVCTSVDILYTSLEAVSNQILASPSTYASLVDSSVDRLKEHSATNTLKSLKFANPFIKYIGFYNAASDRYLSNSCVSSGLEINVGELFRSLGDSKYSCLMRSLGETYPTSAIKTLPVYTFVFGVKLSGTDTKNIIIIDVDATYFTDVLSNIRTKEVYQQIAFVDSNNKIITKRDAQPGDAKFTAAPAFLDFDIGDLHTLSINSGSFIHDGKAGRSFTTYARAASADWVVVNIVPFTSILNGLQLVALLTLILVIVTLLIGYYLSRRASRTLSAPIRELYENFVEKGSDNRTGNELERLSEAFKEMYEEADRLEQGLISSYTQSKNMYMRRLFNGEVSYISSALPIYERLDIDLHSPYYSILLIECIQNSSSQERSTDAGLFIYQYALSNMITEITGKYCRMDIQRISENTFGVLLYLNDSLFPAGLMESLKAVPVVMEREFDIETTICIGSVASSWQNINMVFEQTRISMNSRTIDMHGHVFFSIEKGDSLRADQYYNKLHDKFSEFIRNNDITACEREFDIAIASMDTISFKTARAYFKHIMMSVLDDFSLSFERDDDAFSALLSYADDIDSRQNIRGLREVMMSFLTSLMTRLESMRKNSNQDAAEKAKAYIDKNFANPDLTLKMLSDIVNLSPAYLGKIFTSVTSYTFNDYLSYVRMNKAAELLVETKQPIASISEAVGMLNTNYFYSLFKKQFNVTPSEYRKTRKNN